MNRTINKIIAFTCCISLGYSCQTVEHQVATLQSSAKLEDPHSYSNFQQVQVHHLDLDLKVDFNKKQLQGSASWKMDRVDPKAEEVVFDAYKLEIDSIKLDDTIKALYHMGKHDAILGSALTVKVKSATQKVTIFYRTGTEATALQWLTAQQTFGKKHPFLYTQGESIYTRTWIPCQDAPSVRFTYNASIETPKELTAVMSASINQNKKEAGVYKFTMNQKIPSYLVALAVGDLKFQSITDNIGVYAEPSQLQRCVAELADLGKMMQAAESLYGPYAWERYDVLFLPSGFPFGGMENPRLTFATPTILTGDKSLVNLIAHELAHSWSGNLVTNATWNDFWLNESFTVYFERRIMEAVEGKEYAAMLWDIGLQDLNNSIKKYTANKKLVYSKLKLDLKGKDPDLGLTDFAYEKGAAMLLLIEQTIGRPALDSFIHQYFEAKKFTSVFTNDFDAYISATLFKQYPQLRQTIKFDEWVYEEGLPSNYPKVLNPRFDQVSQVAQQLIDSLYINPLQTKAWSTFEWLHFLRIIQPNLTDTTALSYLDQNSHLSNSSNSEIAMQWYLLSIDKGYQTAYEPMGRFLKYTGRMKFLEPLYEALHLKGGANDSLAQKLYDQNLVNYHPLAQKSVGQLIGRK